MMNDDLDLLVLTYIQVGMFIHIQKVIESVEYKLVYWSTTSAIVFKYTTPMILTKNISEFRKTNSFTFKYFKKNE